MSKKTPLSTVTALLVALVATALVLTGCSANTGRTKLVIGSVGGWLEGHLQHAGLLSDLPYDVEFKDLAGTSAYATLGAGQVDVGVWGIDANGTKTMADGSPAKIIALIGAPPQAKKEQGVINLFVSQQSGIGSLADLRGKTIGVNWGQGTTADVVLHGALAEANLSIDDINVKYFADSSGNTAFLSRQVDGFITSYNGAIVNDIENNGSKAIYFANQASTVAYVIASRAEVIQDDAKSVAVADFVTRVTRYYDWRGEDANLEAFTQAVAEEQSAELPLAEGVAKGIGKTVQVLPFSEETIAAYQSDLDKLLQWGMIEQPVTADQFLDRTFADAIDAAR